ncbi:TetR family transcriptional regulator [Kutzneria sp. NPDC051319]|uniref:TetR family transcriptional regulator n=1 Tax=Kutzneria sp. NPDC051319 TaxID=3155047 RepID=UPI0034406EAB
MEQIAEAAGLTRITVHHRFANRQALLEALAAAPAGLPHRGLMQRCACGGQGPPQAWTPLTGAGSGAGRRCWTS